MKRNKNRHPGRNGSDKAHRRNFFRDNSLVIVLSFLFLACLLAQCLLAWRSASHTTVSFWQNLGSGAFIDGLATNWQAAFLQLAVLTIFSSFLVQRGAPHSRQPDKTAYQNSQQARQRDHHGWLYSNSLFLAFLGLFLAAMAVHARYGWVARNQLLVKNSRSGISFFAFFNSARFWSSNFQTWQAEFLAIALFVWLSIFLRQKNSAESKPVDTSDNATGKVNK